MPTSTGTWTFSLKATAYTSGESATKDFTIVVAGKVDVTTVFIPEGYPGLAYSLTISGTGGVPPYTWALESGTLLPSGLTLDTIAGVISGTPAEIGQYAVTVRITDTIGTTGTKILHLNVVDDSTEVAWLQTIHGTYNDSPTSILVDKQDNIYVGGNFETQITTKFDTQGNLLPCSLPLAYDMGKDTAGNIYTFYPSTSKYDPNGVLLWTKNTIASIRGAVDAAGNSYGGKTLQNPSVVQILKLDPRGRQLWLKTFDFGIEEELYDLDIDPMGNIFVLAQDSVTKTMLTAKINAAGTLLWSRLFSTTELITPAKLAVNAAGEVYVAGGDYAAYSWILLVKYDANGNLLWSTKYHQYSTSAVGITLDALGRVYVTGSSFNGHDHEFFTLKFDTGGSLLWAERFDINPAPGLDEGMHVAVDSRGGLIVAGESTESSYSDTWVVKFLQRDADLDGYSSDVDCHDLNPAVNPGAVEVPKDGIDNDCNGYDNTITVTKATWSKSTRSLVVEATSSLKANAALNLLGTGAMSYNTAKNLWTKTATNVNNPLTVTVSGPEGETKANVAIVK